MWSWIASVGVLNLIAVAVESRFIERPSNQKVIENTTVTFHCNATGNPAPKITWTKNDKTIGEGNKLIFVAYRNQSGEYICIADNGLNSTVNASATLEVQYAPSLISAPKDKTIIEGASVTFYCNVTGNPPPKITWIKDGKTVTSGNKLTFKTSRNQSGLYWCSAENGLNSTVNASASLDVQFTPKIVTGPSNQTVVEHEEVKLHCTATGNPVPEIQWIRNGSTMGTGNDLEFQASRNDSGRYVCVAQNGLSDAVNASALLDVQYPPYMTSSPTSQTIIEADNATFRCSATGNPIPEITWLKDGKPVGSGETLEIKAHRNNSGEYLCLANNGLNSTVKASAHLDVLYLPRIIARAVNQTVHENTEVMFHCNAIGNPAPEIAWFKDGRRIVVGSNLNFTALRNDSGKYWCLADNGLNATVNSIAYLNVKYPPSFARSPFDQNVTEGDEISISCTAVGNPVPVITWVKDKKAVGMGTTLNLNAFRNATGEYLCWADNGLGQAIKAAYYIDVRYQPSLTTTLVNQTIRENSTVTFRCEAMGNPVPKITWIKDKQVIGRGPSLRFEAERRHSGKYWCLASNGISETVNASAFLDVLYQPSLTTRPTNQTVTEFSLARFLCSATGNPTPKITWTKDDKIVGERDALIFSAKRNQSGKYWCTADNGLNLIVHASANLEVQFLPSFTVEPNDQTVIEMSTATLKCSATGNPTPRITWIKDGETVGSGELLSFVAYRNLSGEYWCSADNGLGEAINSSALLYVQFKPERTRLTVNTDITKPVQFSISVMLNCTTHSRPDPEGYKFYRDQEFLGSNSSGAFYIQLQRSGLYSCRPFNSAGDGQEASLHIEVDAWKPSFGPFGPFYLFKGTQARLPCKPYGVPYPTLQWFKDGEAIRHGQNESHALDSDGSLVISNVKDRDSGTYTCIAKNYLGESSATADGILLERTQIVVKPQNHSVTKGASLDLSCIATVDPSLELIYLWKRDGAVLTSDSNILWPKEGNVLRLKDITFQDVGVYTCIAYTPEPRGSKDSASATVSIIGVPSPPTGLQLTDCYSGHTNLSWSIIFNSPEKLTYYLVEQETNHEPHVFKTVFNVTNPDVTSASLTVPGWSTLRFRVRAANRAGPGRPSEATKEGLCITPVGAPKKYPSNLRGVATKANELFITWNPVPKTEWDASGFYYILKYRKSSLGFPNEWKIEKIGDPGVGVFAVTNAGYYRLWEFTIRAGNHEGLGPASPVQRSFSGQDAPAAKPGSAKADVVTATSATIAWKPVTVKRGSVDGYKMYYWGESRIVSSRMRREIIPSTANVISVPGAKTQSASLTGLKPYNSYQVVVKAFNTGGEGPPSNVIVIETLESEPGPPSDVRVSSFGEFILVSWKPPKEPNGVITDYQIGCAEYNGLSPYNISVSMETVRAGPFKKLLGNLTFERNYVVALRARTNKGWGESARETARTIKRMAPSKPGKPTVVGTGKHVISLKYNYGVGGGWTHEFKVLYRKQAEGGEFKETKWMDHFSTQLVEVNSLDTEVYEFKTVGKNSVGTSPQSDVIEARPEPDPVVSGQRGNPPVYSKDWFITLIILSACTLSLLVIVISYKSWKRRRSSNFEVTEQEKENGKEKIRTEVPVDIKARQEWRNRIQDKVEVESQDSLDEYGGGGAFFSEDGSFVGDLKQGGKRESVYDEIPLDDPVV